MSVNITDIRNSLNDALRSGEGLRVSVLRMLLSEINYRQIEVQHDLGEAEILDVIRKEVKKRKEAIESWKAAGRSEQVESEAAELEILEKYLPTLMSEEAVRQEIETMENIRGMTDFGKIMKELAPRFRGRADGQVVAKIVKEMTVGDGK